MRLQTFQVQRYITNGAIFKWSSETGSVTAYRIFAGDTNTGPWDLIYEDSSGTFTEVAITQSIVPSTTAWFKLEADTIDSTTEELLLQEYLFGLSGSQAVPIAIDETGAPRSLKVDSGGNLVVTGITMGSPGTGDASAALQNQQISLSEVTNSKLDILDTSINGVTTKLDDVRLNASQITDLKTVAVSNIPINFPDTAAYAKLTSIDTKVATELTLGVMSTKIDEILKQSDLSFISGAVVVSIANFPADYADSAANIKLADIDLGIDGLNSGLSTLNSAVSDIKTITLPLILTAAEDTVAGVSLTNTIIQSDLLPLLDQGFLDTVAGIADGSKETTLQALNTKTDLLVKTSDIPLSLSGEVRAQVANFPASYPDPVAVSVLNDILIEVSPLDTSNVSITSPLPPGANTVGNVGIVSIPLPPDASKESTQLLVKNRLDALNIEIASSAPNSLKDRITRLEVKLDDILEALQIENTITSVFLDSNRVIASGATFTSTAINISGYEKSTIGLQVITTTTGVRLTAKGSFDGLNFSTIQGMSSLSVNGQTLYSLTLGPIAPYIQLVIFNQGVSPVTVTTSVRGEK